MITQPSNKVTLTVRMKKELVWLLSRIMSAYYNVAGGVHVASDLMERATFVLPSDHKVYGLAA